MSQQPQTVTQRARPPQPRRQTRFSRWLYHQTHVGPLRRKVIALAWPTIGEQILQTMLGIFNQMIVGSLGMVAVAGIGLAEQIVQFLTVAFAAFTVGTTALVARCIGAGQREQAEKATKQSLLLVTGIGLGIAALAYFGANTGLRLMDAQPDVMPVSFPYMRVVAISTVFMAISLVANGAMRGAGDTRTPLYIALLMNAVNIGLNYGLVFGYFGLPRLGTQGSAYASLTARFIGASLGLLALSRGRTVLRVNLLRGWQPDTSIMKRVMTIGIPAALEQLVQRSGMMMYTRIVTGLGTEAYAAHRIALNVESMSYMPGMGFSTAATTLVGQGLGAKKPRTAEAAGRETWLLATYVMTAMGLVFFFFSRHLTGLFIKNAPGVTALAALVLKVEAIAQPAQATGMVMSGALRGAGDTFWTMINVSVGIWCVRLPIAFILARYTPLGLVGAWIAMTADLWIRGGLMLRRFLSGRWKAIKV
ncbi:MAG: MATE family efflux transporter [Chloroflexota bacterium]